MSWLLLAGAALALGAVTFGPRVYRFCTFWSRLTTISTSLGAYDSHRQAESASHAKTGIRPRPPERGHVRPLLGAGWAHGLPRCWVIFGKTVPPKDKFPEFVAEAEHHSGIPWTLTRQPRGRSLVLAQAPPLPAPDALPPMVLPAWCLPVGVARSGHVWWDTRVDAHMLVVARTRWGKTTWARWLAGYAERSSFWQVVWVDPETQDPATMLWRLAPVMREFAKRAPDDDPDRPRILVIVDEFPKVVRVPPKHAADYQTRREIAEAVDQLLDRGGKRGIDLLDLTVDPRATAIGGHVRSSHGARLAAWLDDDEYRITLGRAVPNARKGPRGVGWWLAEGGFPEEVQVYSGAWPRAEYTGRSRSTAERIIPALGTRKRR